VILGAIMRVVIRNLLFAFGLGIAMSSVVGSAGAVTMSTYSFTGPNFDGIADPNPPAGSYTNAMQVTGSFTAPTLGANVPLTNILGSIDFFFTDGRRTMTPADINPTYSYFKVSTNSGGDILYWQVALVSGFPAYISQLGAQQNRILFASTTLYQGYTEGDIYECTVPQVAGYCSTINEDYGYSSYPGRWAAPVTVTATPLPGSISLLSSVLGGLGFFGWLRQRARLRVA
jgi:hypothetical protein